MRATILSIFVSLNLAQTASTTAPKKDIHMDCARTNQTVAVDVDPGRLFVQLMWSEGVGEEFKDGDSYISGPDSFGRKEKVNYVVSIDDNIINFGLDRICMEDGTKGKCVDRHLRDTLDMRSGELKYDDGDMVAILKCVPAPPGRGF
jgi:ethanolamine ammonia-lyase small subunit